MTLGAPAVARPSASRKRLWVVVAAAVALLGILLARRLCFVQDDAFISFTYARNLVQGHGLTWFGDRVEGYSNFLWVMWIALGLRLGADPIVWSYAGGLAAFAAMLYALWRLGLLLLGGPLPALAVLCIAITNATCLRFATGGLETMLQTALLALAALQFVHLLLAARAAEAVEPGRKLPLAQRCLALSSLLAAAMLTRLDSALPAVILLGGAGAAIARARSGTRTSASLRRNAFLALAFPLVAIVGPWFAWKLSYYGSVLPNTYHAKVGWDVETLGAGSSYLWRFLRAYLLWPFLLLGGVAWVARRVVGRAARARPAAAGDAAAWSALAIALATWWVYLAAIGGDFIEFRMLVPLAPVLFLLLVRIVGGALPRHGAVATGVMALVLALASLHHGRSFRGVTADRRLDSVPALANFYGVYPDRNFSTLGRELGRQLAGTDALLALHAVGAIPYYSELRTLDMYGLNDRRVAREGNRPRRAYRRPGHQRQVSIADLRERRVNLVIGHPTLAPRGELADPRSDARNAQWVRDTISFSDEPIGEVTLVGMPLPRGGVLRMWYLTPSPAIDAVMRSRGWESVTQFVPR